MCTFSFIYSIFCLITVLLKKIFLTPKEFKFCFEGTSMNKQARIGSNNALIMLNGSLIASYMTLRDVFRGLANVCSRVELRPFCVDLSRRAFPLDQLRLMCLRLQKRVCLSGLRIGSRPIPVDTLAHFLSSLHTFHLSSLIVQV